MEHNRNAGDIIRVHSSIKMLHAKSPLANKLLTVVELTAEQKKLMTT